MSEQPGYIPDSERTDNSKEEITNQREVLPSAVFGYLKSAPEELLGQDTVVSSSDIKERYGEGVVEDANRFLDIIGLRVGLYDVTPNLLSVEGQIYINVAAAPKAMPKDHVMHRREQGLDDIRFIVEKCRHTSFVGHADAARMYSDVLGVEVPYNRGEFSLKHGDIVVVGEKVGRSSENPEERAQVDPSQYVWTTNMCIDFLDYTGNIYNAGSLSHY